MLVYQRVIKLFQISGLAAYLLWLWDSLWLVHCASFFFWTSMQIHFVGNHPIFLAFFLLISYHIFGGCNIQSSKNLGYQPLIIFVRWMACRIILGVGIFFGSFQAELGWFTAGITWPMGPMGPMATACQAMRQAKLCDLGAAPASATAGVGGSYIYI